MRDLTVGQACDVFTETTGQPWVVRQIVQTGLSPMFWFNPSECWFRPSDGKALARWPDGFRARMNFQDGGAILEQTSEAVYVDHVTTPDSVMVSPARPLRVPISEISYRRTEVMAAAAVFKSIPAPRPDAAKTKAVHGALVSYPEQIRQQVIQEALQQLAQQNAADHPATNPAGKQQTPGHGPGSGTVSAQDRQAQRWQMCVEAGLKMPPDSYAPLPRGISKVADSIGIKRQSFTQDLKAHQARLFRGPM